MCIIGGVVVVHRTVVLVREFLREFRRGTNRAIVSFHFIIPPQSYKVTFSFFIPLLLYLLLSYMSIFPFFLFYVFLFYVLLCLVLFSFCPIWSLFFPTFFLVCPQVLSPPNPHLTIGFSSFPTPLFFFIFYFTLRFSFYLLLLYMSIFSFFYSTFFIYVPFSCSVFFLPHLKPFLSYVLSCLSTSSFSS